MIKPIKRDKLVFRKSYQTVLGLSAVATLLAACGTSDSALFNIPAIPAAKSALVAPELTTSCPITNS
jgi:uncharacterized lipoprotein YajG